MKRTSSWHGPLLDVSGAAIQDGPVEAGERSSTTIVLPNQQQDVFHFAVDIGGSLIKLVYFSRASALPAMDRRAASLRTASISASTSASASASGSTAAAAVEATETEAEAAEGLSSKSRRADSLRHERQQPQQQQHGGRLHFVKFETSKLEDCLQFIKSKRLHRPTVLGSAADEESVWGYGEGEAPGAGIKATGGGAFKFADHFKQHLGVRLDKQDEMQCLVAGLNFLIRAIRDEAFTHVESQKEFKQLHEGEVFPYMLVNIGSGVSILKVDGPNEYQRVSGTNLGGGTFWGLGSLLTGCKSFDDILELSQAGDNSAVDMLVGDIYGGLDYAKIGLSASTIASSFGKVVGESKSLEEYNKADIALSLLRMISYNIGQIAYLNALRFNLKRIFFGGFFIRGHAYTMDTISFAINFWSKGQMEALFLRHEGYLGALGAFLSYEALPGGHSLGLGLAQLKPAQLVERFPIGASLTSGEIKGPPIRGLDEKISWMEKFVQVGSGITGPTPTSTPAGCSSLSTGMGGFDPPSSRKQLLRSDRAHLTVGVLHLVPSLEPFPLLADPKGYEPNTLDLSDPEEREYWLTILEDHLPNLVEKAAASEGATDDAKRRADAFAHALRAHLSQLRHEPSSYGRLGLATLLEMREECLREFHFSDSYRAIKQRENEVALAVLPDLLMEIDGMDEPSRLLALIEGVLAANIFDWGSKECVKLYQSGAILDIYRQTRDKMKRPWRIDDFDLLAARWLSAAHHQGSSTKAAVDGDKIADVMQSSAHRKALLFVDNAGADVVLGMLPLAREMLRRGTDVVMVANSLPAINDITAAELVPLLAAASAHCQILRSALTAGDLLDSSCSRTLSSPTNSQQPAAPSPLPTPRLSVVASGSGSPCLDLRHVSSELAAESQGADFVVLEGMGRSLHTNFNAQFKCDTLKLAMIKNKRLACQLVNGDIYDCVCRYEPQMR